MKIFRIVMISCLLAASLSSGGAVFAQDEALPNPGLTPDNPFYFLDKWGKGLGLFFTFGNEAKAKKALQYGEERLAEAEAMANQDRIREMERAAADYQGYMDMVNERVENGGVSDNITERVCLSAERHLAVMERIRERVRDQAGDAIANAENSTVNGQINALRVMARNRIQRAAELTADAVEKHMERARVRIMTGLATDNATGKMELCLDYAERLGQLEDEFITAAEESGIDVTSIQERLANSAANRLEVLDEVYENAPAAARNGIENAIENSVRKYERTMERLRARNALGNVPDEATVKNRIREEVRERLQITIRNVENEPQDTVLINTESPGHEQNRQGFTDDENGSNGSGSSNQTGEQPQNQGNDNNGKHGN